MRLRRGRRDQEEADQDQAKILKVSLYIYSVLFAGLLDVQSILWVDTVISEQTEGHSFGDHLSSESVRVTPLRVIEASVVLCSVSL
jgi:hypothetical protein